MWVLPTYGRPLLGQRALDSIIAAGCTSPGVVVVNGEDDPAYRELRLPDGWSVHFIPPPNVGCCAALNEAFARWPDEAWYGFISDDSVVRTSFFDVPLIEAAGRAGFANSSDGWQAQRRMHGAIVFGGDLLRAIGWWAPPGLKHSFVDNVWERIARALDNWRHVPRAMVEHLHVGNAKAANDATYEKAYSSFDADQAVYRDLVKTEIPAAIARASHVAYPGDVLKRRMARAKSRRVMIGTPCARAPVLEYTLAFADTSVHLDRSGVGFASQFVVGSSNLPRARNEIVARFLASDCTDLIFIDDDMGWKPEAVIRLLASDQQVIAGVGRKKVAKPNSDPEVWCFGALTLGKDGLDVPPQDAMGAVEVAAVGTAFLKIERSVFEDLIKAHPEWKRDGHDGMSAEVKANYYQFFRFDPDDTSEMGEDYVFCQRWREAGGSIWIDPEIELTHVGPNAWSGRVAEIMMVENPELEQAA